MFSRNNSFLIILNKNFIKFNFKLVYYYYFLSNNLLFINNFIDFNFINNFIFKSFFKINKNNFNMKKIKKNNFNMKKKFRFFKSSIKFQTFLFFYMSKLNKIFKNITWVKILFNKKFKKNKIKFLPSFFFNKNIFFKNWHFLIGNLISPYFWSFITKKNYLKQKINLNFIKHKFFFKKKFNIFQSSNAKKNNFFKKLFVNNFFYINKLNISYNDFCYLMKAKIQPSDKILLNTNWILIKPYLFLNNNEIMKNYHFSLNSSIYSLYKNSTKIFNLVKKSFFKFISNIFFKKIIFKKSYFFLKNNLIKHSKNFAKISFFNYKVKKIIKNVNNIKKKNKNKFKINSKFFFFLYIFSRLKLFKIKKRYNIAILNLFYVIKKKIKKNYLNSKKYRKINTWFNLLFSIKKYNNFKYNNFKYNKFKYNKFKYNKFKCNKFKCNKFINFLLFKIKKFKFFYFWNEKKNFLYKKNINFFPFHSKLFSNVYANFKYVSFNSKEKTNFLLNKHGFIYLTDFLIENNSKFNLILLLKNTLYSFLQKNELQKYILKKHARNQIITDFLLSDKNFFLKKNNLLYKNNYFNCFFNFSSINLFRLKIYSNPLISSSNQSSKWNYFNEQILYIKNQFSDISDFNIKRTRFKPGYMNIWRDARKVFKLSLNLKMKYQYKLTRYLLRFKKFLKIKMFLYKEMQLKNILLKSKFFPDTSSTNIFIRFNLIFLNGSICLNALIQLIVGDLIQLIISSKYYILYKWFLNWTLKKKIKLKEIIKKKINIKFNLEEKQRNHSLPKWILENKNIINDNPRYLEIDYFTMSILIIYEPFSWFDLTYYNFIDNKFSITNIYNWKYIT